ncbi:MAG: hypothetical protein HY033_00420 [Ignavibacteriae bacterium]|nr:hypothetical protein [Ignavibacteriota bacterium]
MHFQARTLTPFRLKNEAEHPSPSVVLSAVPTDASTAFSVTVGRDEVEGWERGYRVRVNSMERA